MKAITIILGLSLLTANLFASPTSTKYQSRTVVAQVAYLMTDYTFAGVSDEGDTCRAFSGYDQKNQVYYVNLYFPTRENQVVSFDIDEKAPAGSYEMDYDSEDNVLVLSEKDKVRFQSDDDGLHVEAEVKTKYFDCHQYQPAL